MDARWLLSVLLGVVVVLMASAADERPKRPNVVVFLADDLGIGDIGCFGNGTIKTPNIDRIARNGAKLTHHLTAAALCTPSRAALLTGRYPIRSGMASHHVGRVILFVPSESGIPQNETTFAEVAQKNGYATALVGKWHLGVHCKVKDFCHHPLSNGFDSFYGTPMTNLKDYGDSGDKVATSQFQRFNPILLSIIAGTLVAAWSLFRFRLFGWCGVGLLLVLLVFPASVVLFVVNNFKLMNSMIMRDFEVVEQPIRFRNLTQRFVNEGTKFLEERQKDKKPFLLMMSWLQVHTVLYTSNEFKGHSVHGAFGDNVEEMDWGTGEIVNALERMGLLENTLVYFTSDNGGHLEEKGHDGSQEGGWHGIYRGGKGQGGMEGGIRVPTVMMWKNHIKPQTVIDVPTSLMDVFPTLVASVFKEKLPMDRVIDGRNIYPLLSGKDPTPPHKFLFHYCGTDIHAARYTPGNGRDVYKVHYATPRWIGDSEGCGFMCHCNERHVTRHDPPLLYNIAKDPSEKTLLDSSDPENRKIIQVIGDAVRSHRRGVDEVPSQFAFGRMAPRPWLQPYCNFPYFDCVDPEYGYLHDR